MADHPLVPLLISRMRALLARIEEALRNPKARFFRPGPTLELFHQAEGLRAEAKLRAPLAFGDHFIRDTPKSSGTSDFDGEGYLERAVLEQTRADLKYCVDVLEGGAAPGAIADQDPAPRLEPVDVAEVSLGEVLSRYPIGKLLGLVAAILGLGLSVGFAAGRWMSRAEGSDELVQSLRAATEASLKQAHATAMALDACQKGPNVPTAPAGK